VRIARSDTARRERLHANIAHFRHAARRAGLALLPSATPIQPVSCGSEAETLAMARALEDAGFWVGAIRPPTVPQGGSRLRITLSAQHAITDIDALIGELARASEAALRHPRTDAGA